MTACAAAPGPGDVVLDLEVAAHRLLAGRVSGLYESLDGGQTWRPLLAVSAIQGLPVNAVLSVPADGLLLAGTPRGLLRSDDDGDTWALLPLARPAVHVSTLRRSPALERDGTLLAGTVEDGVFVSTDAGRHWQGWNLGLFDRQIVALAVSPAFAADRSVVAATNLGLVLSQNGGRRWRALALPGGAGAVTALAIGAAPGAALAVGTDTGQVWLSTDWGDTWDGVARLPAAESVPSLEFLDDTLYILTDQALVAARRAAAGWGAAGALPAPGAEPACFRLAAAPAGPLAFVGDIAGQVRSLPVRLEAFAP
ncbi:MAG: hypothetical protein IT317_03680 [Anaerolineales bacterium]|nr:hypothetical protein [Anaerolineales bacterium]